MSEPPHTTVQILDPTVADTIADVVPRADRLESIRGAGLGLIANGKTHSLVFLQRIAKNLDSRHGLAGTTELTKKSAGRPVDGAEIEMVAAHAMAVLAAIGD